MRRFFVDPAAITGTTVTLRGPEAHHLGKVLRLKPGAIVILFDGAGKQYEATVEELGNETVILTIRSTTANHQPFTELHLGQGLLKGKKMDLVIQKATELGVAAIHPFVSQHAAVRLPEAEKESRWQRIALEACKQCNQPRPPLCHPAKELSALLRLPQPFDRKILFWEQPGGTSLRELFPPTVPLPRSIFFLIGPEGGFSRAEHLAAEAAGFTTVTLGTRVLRAETATIAATAILQFLVENRL